MDQTNRDPGPAPTGRLAPSPTGGLHLGHARTFLVAWLSARAGDGRMILRIEDLDATRARPGAGAQAMADLRWLGLDWDEGPDRGGPASPYVQSERTEAYRVALGRLIAEDRVYPCTCTRADIERAASAPHAGEGGPAYPGTCSKRSAIEVESLDERRFAWRFRLPPGPVLWDDRFLGPMSVDPAMAGGDFIVARSSGEFAYQLAVVADDAAMGVTEVVRGDDLIDSTPRQILLYRALGLASPTFAHVPLVIGPDGRRLAKRDGSIRLASLREAGMDPEWLVGLLAQSCGWADRLIPSRPGDWIANFSLATMPRSPWVAGPELLGRTGVSCPGTEAAP